MKTYIYLFCIFSFFYKHFDVNKLCLIWRTNIVSKKTFMLCDIVGVFGYTRNIIFLANKINHGQEPHNHRSILPWLLKLDI